MPGQVPTETEGVNPSSGKPHFVIMINYIQTMFHLKML